MNAAPAALLGGVLLACGSLHAPRPGTEGVPTFDDDLHTTANQVPRYVAGARRAGCTIQENDPQAFSARCPRGEAAVVVACVQRGMVLHRGCRAGTPADQCQLVWADVLSKVEP